MTASESPLAPDVPLGGTRKRLDHIDAMRPVKQAGVVSTHTLLAFAPVGAGITVGASLMLLHVTREAFLFISACMLAYSYRESLQVELHTYWKRRFLLVGVPYLCWTVIYFLYTLPTASESFPASLRHLAYLAGTGYYQLYYLVVLMEFYCAFPLMLLILRRTAGHHGALLAVSGAVQVTFVSVMHWGILPWWMQGFWASREITSYQFYLFAGLVIALHLEDVHSWLCGHVKLVVAFTVVSAGFAEAWYCLAADHVLGWLGPSSDPFQPVVIPFNIGAIATVYLIGVALVSVRRTHRTRALAHLGSEDSYGIYLAQMIFITGLGWLGWRHLNALMPWPILSLITVAVVFTSCIGLTELLVRTPLARSLTGRTRIPWHTVASGAALESTAVPINPPILRQPDRIGAGVTAG